MKRILVVMVMVLISLAIMGCQQQEKKQQQVTYTPAAPPMLLQIDQLQQAANVAPKNAQGWTRLGDALMDAQRFSEAIEAYGKSLALEPKNVPVLVDQGTCYRGVGQFNKAVEQYRKALKIEPNFPNGHRNLGVVLGFDLNQRQEALKSFKRYLELVPTGPDADSVRQAMQQLSATGTSGR